MTQHTTTHRGHPPTTARARLHRAVLSRYANCLCQRKWLPNPKPCLPFPGPASNTLHVGSVLPAAAAATERRQAPLNIHWLQQEKCTKAPPTNRHSPNTAAELCNHAAWHNCRHACNMTLPSGGQMLQWTSQAGGKPGSIHTHAHVYGNTPDPNHCAVPLSLPHNTHHTHHTRRDTHTFSNATGCYRIWMSTLVSCSACSQASTS